MPTNLLILPLVGGFWFIHWCYYTRFRAQGLDGNRLLFESALAGTAFGVVAWIIREAILHSPVGDQAVRIWSDHGLKSVDFSATACLTFVLCLTSPFLVNLFVREKAAKKRAVVRHGNGLHRLTHDCALTENPILITLDTLKFYLGYVAVAPNMRANEYLDLYPIVSGVRDKETLKMRLTTDYRNKGFSQPVYITVPVSTIKIASKFSIPRSATQTEQSPPASPDIADFS